jgi:hypothetical protein
MSTETEYYNDGITVDYTITIADGVKLEGEAILRGVATTGIAVLGVTYILEDLAGNFPNKTYPYKCFVLSEIFFHPRW